MIFPYLSEYILIFSVLSFIFFLIHPVPYGKHYSKLPIDLEIDNVIANGLIYLPALICIFGYYDTDESKWVSDMHSKPKGQLALIVFIIYIIWRGLISKLVTHNIVKGENVSGVKKTSFFIVLYFWFYYPVLGMLVRYMCVHMDEDFEARDVIFMIASLVFFVANAMVDVYYNKWRLEINNRVCNDDGDELGVYLLLEDIKAKFQVLVKLKIDCPNYFFELLAWVFFTLYCMNYSSLWILTATILIITPRALWTSEWVSNQSKGPPCTITKETKPMVRPTDKYKPQKIYNNGLVF